MGEVQVVKWCTCGVWDVGHEGLRDEGWGWWWVVL